LYLAEIPDSDFSLFRNLDKVFSGHARETPAEGVRYFLGVDLARKKDFTSATVISEDGHVVAMERFSQMDWSLQVQRVALLYRTFCCGKAVCDSTGLGDPVCEQLEDLGLDVERYTFTVPSRKALLEELILSCDNTEITVPASEKFKIYRAELESFEYVLDGVTAKYAAPGHDDCVMSLALAVHGFRAARGWVLGLLDLLKRKAKEVINGVRDSFGELVHKPEPKVVAERPETIAKPAVLDNFAIWLKTNRAPACPLCKSTATTFNEQRKVRCNQCQSVDGVPLPKPVGACCGNFLPQMIGGGGVRCGNCGAQSPLQGVAVGVSRSDYAAGVGRHRSYRRFG